MRNLGVKDILQALVIALFLGFSTFLYSGVEEAKKTDVDLKVYKAETTAEIKSLKEKVEEVKQDTKEIREVKNLLETLIKLQRENANKPSGK